MKKVILGIGLMAIGFLGFAILCSGAMCSQFTVNGSNYFIDIWRVFGITPVALIFVVIAAVGIILSIVGLFSKSKP